MSLTSGGAARRPLRRADENPEPSRKTQKERFCMAGWLTGLMDGMDGGPFSWAGRAGLDGFGMAWVSKQQQGLRGGACQVRS